MAFCISTSTNIHIFLAIFAPTLKWKIGIHLVQLLVDQSNIAGNLTGATHYAQMLFQVASKTRIPIIQAVKLPVDRVVVGFLLSGQSSDCMQAVLNFGALNFVAGAGICSRRWHIAWHFTEYMLVLYVFFRVLTNSQEHIFMIKAILGTTFGNQSVRHYVCVNSEASALLDTISMATMTESSLNGKDVTRIYRDYCFVTHSTTSIFQVFCGEFVVILLYKGSLNNPAGGVPIKVLHMRLIYEGIVTSRTVAFGKVLMTVRVEDDMPDLFSTDSDIQWIQFRWRELFHHSVYSRQVYGTMAHRLVFFCDMWLVSGWFSVAYSWGLHVEQVPDHMGNMIRCFQTLQEFRLSLVRQNAIRYMYAELLCACKQKFPSVIVCYTLDQVTPITAQSVREGVSINADGIMLMVLFVTAAVVEYVLSCIWCYDPEIVWHYTTCDSVQHELLLLILLFSNSGYISPSCINQWHIVNITSSVSIVCCVQGLSRRPPPECDMVNRVTTCSLRVVVQVHRRTVRSHHACVLFCISLLLSTGLYGLTWDYRALLLSFSAYVLLYATNGCITGVRICYYILQLLWISYMGKVSSVVRSLKIFIDFGRLHHYSVQLQRVYYISLTTQLQPTVSIAAALVIYIQRQSLRSFKVSYSISANNWQGCGHVGGLSRVVWEPGGWFHNIILAFRNAHYFRNVSLICGIRGTKAMITASDVGRAQVAINILPCVFPSLQDSHEQSLPYNTLIVIRACQLGSFSLCTYFEEVGSGVAAIFLDSVFGGVAKSLSRVLTHLPFDPGGDKSDCLDNAGQVPSTQGGVRCSW